ncbi:MAG: cobalt ABC transporter substrate-binding protein [Lautropia sp.]
MTKTIAQLRCQTGCTRATSAAGPAQAAGRLAVASPGGPVRPGWRGAWLLGAALLAMSLPAAAHQIWIEPAQSGALVVRFGEYGENLREVSPGLLDRFGKPEATLLTGGEARAVALTRDRDGFASGVTPKDGDGLVAEDAAFPLSTFKQGERTVTSWYRPGARFATSMAEPRPRLALDLLPAGEPGRFRVTWQGRPAGRAKVGIVVAAGWSKEAIADDDGLVRFDLPWQGLYLLETSRIDRTPGQRDGASGKERYDGVNHVTTLLIRQATGIEPLPAGPAATPNPPPQPNPRPGPNSQPK